jgi:hypothetical protein
MIKLLRLSVPFIFMLLIFSCNDSDIVCNQDDWAGTYEGNLTLNQDPVTIEIEAISSDTIRISYVLELDSGVRTMTYDNVEVTECEFVQTFLIQGTQIILNGILMEDLLWLTENVYETPGGTISTPWPFSANRI